MQLRTSALLRHLVETRATGRIALADVVATLQDRAFGVVLLICALPNLVPVPIPGYSTVFAVPIILAAAQLMWGRRTPWLPSVLGRRSIAVTDFRRVLVRVIPSFERIERLLRPRLTILVGRTAERFIGFVVFVLAMALALPIPLGNWLPALALSLFALALLENDGVAALVALAVAAASLAIIAGVVAGAVMAAGLALQMLF